MIRAFALSPLQLFDSHPVVLPHTALNSRPAGAIETVIDREAEVTIRRIGVGVPAAAPDSAAFQTDVATGPLNGKTAPVPSQPAPPQFGKPTLTTVVKWSNNFRMQ
jgi:hypothetical protein